MTKRTDGSGAAGGEDLSPPMSIEAAAEQVLAKLSSEPPTGGNSHQSRPVLVTDPTAAQAQQAGNPSDFCWAARELWARTVRNGPRHPRHFETARRSDIGTSIRRGVTRRDSQRSSTVRHAAGSRKRATASSRDDGGGDPPGGHFVGLRGAAGVTP